MDETEEAQMQNELAWHVLDYACSHDKQVCVSDLAMYRVPTASNMRMYVRHDAKREHMFCRQFLGAMCDRGLLVAQGMHRRTLTYLITYEGVRVRNEQANEKKGII